MREPAPPTLDDARGERGDQEIHALACFVHGFLVFGHTLGVLYNVKRRNRWEVIAHGLGIAYSAHAAVHHARRAR